LIEALNGELARKHAEEKEAHGFIPEYGPKTYSELKSIKDALCKLGDWAAVPALMEALTSSPEPSGVFVVLRWVCSQPDGIKLSETKDKLRAYSAFEMNKKGSELKAGGQYWKAMEYFKKAIEIDPDWEAPKKARDDCPRNVDKTDLC